MPRGLYSPSLRDALIVKICQVGLGLRGGYTEISTHHTGTAVAVQSLNPTAQSESPSSGRAGALRSGRCQSYRKPLRPSPCIAPPDEDVLQRASLDGSSAAIELGLLPRPCQDREDPAKIDKLCLRPPPLLSLTQLELI
jgi:hypothetical protein